jgi:hypothetical protein
LLFTLKTTLQPALHQQPQPMGRSYSSGGGAVAVAELQEKNNKNKNQAKETKKLAAYLPATHF